MNSCNTDRFLATTVVCGLSTLNSYATQEQRKKFDEERLSGKQGQSGTGKETTMIAFYTKLKEASNEIKRVVSS